MKKSLIILSVLIFSTIRLHGQSNDSATVYEYVTITTIEMKPKHVYISYSDGRYEELKIESSGRFDYSEVLKIVNQKEQEGFKLFYNNLTLGPNVSLPYNYFILRKESK